MASETVVADRLGELVGEALDTTSFIDIHTHLFPPSFGAMGLWGIDALLTYHYLEAELFRFAAISPSAYHALDSGQKADLVWRTLFVDNQPVSESTRGVVAVLDALGLGSSEATLAPYRHWFSRQSIGDHIDRVFRLAGVHHVVMTNDPLDPVEARFWNRDVAVDPRFRSAIRIDRIVNEWPYHWKRLRELGFDVDATAGAQSLAEVRRFLSIWAARMSPRYMAVSLPDTFEFPADDLRTRLLEAAILPLCRELGLPLALMIGVRRQVNPALRLAGDGSGRADLDSLVRLAGEHPDNRFLVTLLSRENQHELCVLARKFSNLMPFGCWWFLNNPSIVREITRERIEMLGMSFIPQHSDARVLEHLIYKWRNTRRTIRPVLGHAYRLLVEDGRTVGGDDIRRDVATLFRGNFERWTRGA